jgi:hypothetical protein
MPRQPGRSPYNRNFEASRLGPEVIRPIFPSLHQTRPHRIISNIPPLFRSRFVTAQQSVETALLPFPGVPGLLADPTLHQSGKHTYIGIPIGGSSENMDVVGHHDSGEHGPNGQVINGGSPSRKGRRIGQDAMPAIHVERHEIHDFLFPWEPNSRDTRWMRHTMLTAGRGLRRLGRRCPERTAYAPLVQPAGLDMRLLPLRPVARRQIR